MPDKGHGLETVRWAEALSGDLPSALAGIGLLRVRTCNGLFSDLIAQTQNRPLLHIFDKRFAPKFSIRPLTAGNEISLDAIIDRLPDLFGHRSKERSYKLWLRIKDLEYSPNDGARMTVECSPDHPLCAEFITAGFTITKSDEGRFRLRDEKEECIFVMENNRFLDYHPQVFHMHEHKTVGGWSSPYLVSEFGEHVRYSQLAVTYALSYFLGMLARYYPTHWAALMNGEKGDEIWPTLNAAQKYVEATAPELVLDVINDAAIGSIQLDEEHQDSTRTELSDEPAG